MPDGACSIGMICMRALGVSRPSDLNRVAGGNLEDSHACELKPAPEIGLQSLHGIDPPSLAVALP